MGRSKCRKRPLTDVKDKPPDLSMAKPLMQDNHTKGEPTDTLSASLLYDHSPRKSKMNSSQEFFDKLRLFKLLNEKIDSLINSETQSTAHVIAMLNKAHKLCVEMEVIAQNEMEIIAPSDLPIEYQEIFLNRYGRARAEQG